MCAAAWRLLGCCFAVLLGCAAWLCCLAAAAWRLTLRRFKLSHICCCNRCHLPPGETLLTMCTRTASKMACANVCSGTEIASSSTVRAGYLCVQQGGRDGERVGWQCCCYAAAADVPGLRRPAARLRHVLQTGHGRAAGRGLAPRVCSRRPIDRPVCVVCVPERERQREREREREG